MSTYLVVMCWSFCTFVLLLAVYLLQIGNDGIPPSWQGIEAKYLSIGSLDAQLRNVFGRYLLPELELRS